MKLGLQIFSWVAVVLGVLAVIGGLAGGEDSYSSLLGGILFGVEGVLALVYVSQTQKKIA
jgi:uncharacterized membrane protein (UPF0136 family)